jgi:HAD superfamily hydrolase (TIGR01490 family)
MRLALFDFDGTLTTRDSFMPFLHQVVGTPRFLSGLAATSGPLLAYATGLMPNDLAKERVIRHFLGGRSLEDLQVHGQVFASGRLNGLLRASTLRTLQQHVQAGDECVLVSASLDLYLVPWASQHGFSTVLCSSLETDDQQRITGVLAPRNCFGAEKARRIRHWLAGREPTHITAYGDSRGDRDMLALADTAHWIKA